MYAEVNLPAGQYRDGTEYQARGRWYAVNLGRFYEATVRPMKGWLQHSTSAVTGAARAILAWIDNSAGHWIAVGTHNHLYIFNKAGNLFNITPTGLTAGHADATLGGGYGNQLYGKSTYGTPRTDTSDILDCTVWTLDNFGQYLIGTNFDDGRLFEWKLNTAVLAAPLTTDTPPTNNRAVIVTNERFIMALGAAGNPRLCAWGDLGRDDIWTPSPTNQAGFYQLQSPGKIMCGRRVRGGLLVFTDQDVHLGTFQGPPIGYGFQQVGAGCGIISQGAVAVGANVTAWMGRDGFWVYDGSVQPLESDVGDYVFSRLNSDQRSKVSAVHNPTYGEIDWLYPSSAGLEIDSLVRWNYRENHWTAMPFSRLCGAEKGAFDNPLMVDGSGILWEHETGLSYAGASSPYVETGPLELNSQGGLMPNAYAGPSANIMHVLGMRPDAMTLGDVQVSFYTKYQPLSPTETAYGPYTLAPQMDLRFSCRQMRQRFTFLGDGRVGINRLDVRPGGQR